MEALVFAVLMAGGILLIAVYLVIHQQLGWIWDRGRVADLSQHREDRLLPLQVGGPIDRANGRERPGPPAGGAWSRNL